MYAAESKAVTVEKLHWADQVFVMESRHLQDLERQFPDAAGKTPVHVLGIPDIYIRNAPELQEILLEKVAAYLE